MKGVASETSNNMISKYYDIVLCGNNTVGINDHQKNKIKYITPDNIFNRSRGYSDSNKTNCQDYFKNIKCNFLYGGILKVCIMDIGEN